MTPKRRFKLAAGCCLISLAASATAQTAPPATDRSATGKPRSEPSPEQQENAFAAQQEPPADTQEIVVTATKREQNLSQIPASISAIGADLLEKKAVVQIGDLNGAVPGLQVANNNSEISVTVRGVGHVSYSPASENSVALHLDGVYVSRPSAARSAFFDVNRVEVLRGPQGTLYGRNATGGAVNVVSNDPTRDFSGYVSGTYGNYNRADVEGVVSGPLAGDTLLFRVGAFYHSRDGFGTNLPTGDDVESLNEYGFKAALAYQPTDAFSFTLRGDYYHANDSLGGYHAKGTVRQPFPGSQPLPILLGGSYAPDLRDTNYNLPNQRYADFLGVAGILDYDFGGGFSIRSTTGYRETTSNYRTEVSGTQLPIFGPLRSRSDATQVSEEIQLNWKSDDIFAIGGLYYFRETINSSIFIDSYLANGVPQRNIPRILPAPFGVFDQKAHLKTEAKAIFANVDWDVTSRLLLGAGLRYSEETKANRGSQIAFFPDFATYPRTGFDVVDDSRKSRALTPKASIRYEFTDDMNAYASVSRGFKSGEWIAGSSQYARPERVWAYEIGLKGAFFDRALRASVAGFYYDYSNLQVQRVLGPQTFIENVSTGTQKGSEAEATWRLPAGFSVDGNAIYLRTRNGGFVTQDPNIVGSPTVSLEGRRFAFAPTFTLNLGAEKEFQYGGGMSGTFRLDYQHTSDTYLDIFQTKSTNFRPTNDIFNASYRHIFNDQVSLVLWGKNLSDELVVINSNTAAIVNLIVPTAGGTRPPFPSASVQNVNLNEPRTYGVTLKFRW